MNQNLPNSFFNLPSFSSMEINRIENLIQKKITACYKTVDNIISNTNHSEWNDLYYPLMIAENSLKKIWSPLAHLNSVKNDAKIRSAYKKNLLSILEYKTWITHHQGLYESYLKLRHKDSYHLLNDMEKSALNKILLNYELSGISLSNKKKNTINISFLDYQISV